MGISDRRGPQNRRASNTCICGKRGGGVATLTPDDDLEYQDISVNNKSVTVPRGGCGADGTEHRMVTPFICPGGIVSSAQH